MKLATPNLKPWQPLPCRLSPAHYGAVNDLPLSFGPSPNKNGTAFFAHFSGVGYDPASSPKQLCSMSVLMIPGFSGTAHIPPGSSCARASVRPSTAYFVAQYGATSGDVDRPHPELKFTITPLFRSIIAGRKCRRTLKIPLIFTSMTRENSSSGTFHSGALAFTTAALFSSKSGGPPSASTAFAHRPTAASSATSTASNRCGGPNRFATASTCSFCRLQPTIVWPNSAIFSAIARPNPRPAP